MMTVSIWLVFAFSLGLLMRLIGLPPLVGYLAAGFALSFNGYGTSHLLEEVAHAGVLLLLFGVGLKLRLKSMLRAEVLAGSLLHMVITAAVFMLLLLRFSALDLHMILVIALALSFSSTVVAAKVLESKRELRAFHGRVAIGILIIQDLVAVAILSALGGHAPSPWAAALLGLLLVRPLLYKLLDLSGHGELVILYGLMLALVFGGKAFEVVGLSSELGALLLGVILAGHARAKQLANALWGLKELLLVGFFLQIGLYGTPTWSLLEQAALLNLALPFKALLFFGVLLLFRLRARSAFLAGISLASFSEFGLIVASLGVKQGMLGEEWLVLLALAVALSFALSAPLNRHAHEIYEYFESFLQRFETRRRHPDDEPVSLGNSHVVIMGMGRVGTGAYDEFKAQGHLTVGLDSDPGKAEKHRKAGRRVLYADAEDPGFWSHLDLHGVETVVLTMPETEAKVIATRQLRKRGFTGLISATVYYAEDVEPLNRAGADLVYDYHDGIGVGLARLSLERRAN
ncbi:MAG: cation:proton antiporter family protein [Pseudomonadota bacterium]